MPRNRSTSSCPSRSSRLTGATIPSTKPCSPTRRDRPAHGRTRVFELCGAEKVARAAMTARKFAPFVRPALINGTAGAVAFDRDTPFAILAFTVVGDRAVTIDIFNDRELVPRLVFRAATRRGQQGASRIHFRSQIERGWPGESPGPLLVLLNSGSHEYPLCVARRIQSRSCVAASCRDASLAACRRVRIGRLLLGESGHARIRAGPLLRASGWILCKHSAVLAGPRPSS